MSTPTKQRLDTPHGTIEYLDVGSGTPTLYFHGSGAGADSVLVLEQALLESDCRVIIPNRPGYGETSLGRKGCARYCADLAAALLDHLEIERAVVVGTSGGGMPAGCFARLYPNRTAGLVLQCAQSHRWNDGSWLPEGLESTLFYFRHRIFAPLLRWHNLRYAKIAHRQPIKCLRLMSGRRFAEMHSNAQAVEQTAELTRLSLPCAVAPAGTQNDWAILVGDNGIEPDSISRPTLIIHDRADPMVRFRHAEWSQACIPGSRLLEIHAGGHLIWFGRDAALMHAERAAFMRECFER